jgi:hypothetical protein
VPSNTAFATSLASARVGRGELIMLSSISVAVMTGGRAFASAMISFWIAGTRSGRSPRRGRRARP